MFYLRYYTPTHRGYIAITLSVRPSVRPFVRPSVHTFVTDISASTCSKSLIPLHYIHYDALSVVFPIYLLPKVSRSYLSLAISILLL